MLKNNHRVLQHPILPLDRGEEIHFTWNGKSIVGFENETIASALIANGIHIFNHHHKDHSPQGIFCANGQCSQCLVLADGIPVKACMHQIQNDMCVSSFDGLYTLPEQASFYDRYAILHKKIPVLIVGAGPAGLSAAIELGEKGIDTLIVDDKKMLGGKLVLQTHRFFGSKEMVYAGTRGIDIARLLSSQLAQHRSVEIWANSPAIAVFSDHKIGILKDSKQYALVDPDILIIATGARERSLHFPGNTLPGIMGAGAFQTLLNRDLVIPGNNFFVIGGGNVGMIVAYHALQAGIKIAGLAEILPECGGYRVHLDKIKRLGVPVYTSHTILHANGTEHVESVTIGEVDDGFHPMLETAKTIPCDGVLVAAGLNPVDEFFHQARDFGFDVYAAGDAQEIAEASAAIVSGKITTKKVLSRLGIPEGNSINTLAGIKEILAAKPGRLKTSVPVAHSGAVKPVFHCMQEIPCDPCSHLCIHHLITIPPENILAIPHFEDPQEKCVGCAQCVIGCPGLAVTLVDYRSDADFPFITLPYELRIDKEKVIGHSFPVTDREGLKIGTAQVITITKAPKSNHTSLMKIMAPAEIAERIAGIQLESLQEVAGQTDENKIVANETIICRCERVSVQEIRDLIHSGIRDLNLLKAISRAGMGACGGKTCESLILQIMKEEGIPPQEITPFSKRPLALEVSMHAFLEPETNKDKTEH